MRQLLHRSESDVVVRSRKRRANRFRSDKLFARWLDFEPRKHWIPKGCRHVGVGDSDFAWSGAAFEILRERSAPGVRSLLPLTRGHRHLHQLFCFGERIGSDRRTCAWPGAKRRRRSGRGWSRRRSLCVRRQRVFPGNGPDERGERRANQKLTTSVHSGRDYSLEDLRTSLKQPSRELRTEKRGLISPRSGAASFGEYFPSVINWRQPK